MRIWVPLIIAVGLVVAAIVVPLTVTRTVDGESTVAKSDDGLPNGKRGVPGKDPELQALATKPHELWKIDAGLFGPGASGPSIVTANDKVVIVSGDAGAILAVDAKDGRSLWQQPAKVDVNGCALSRDGKLACVGQTHGGDQSVVVATIDLANGNVSSRTVISKTGDVVGDIVSAGNGFITVVRGLSEKETGFTWVSSDGTRTWHIEAPKALTLSPLVSEAGNVLLLTGYEEARAYVLDTGVQVFDSAKEIPEIAERWGPLRSPIQLDGVAHGSGFAIGYSSGDHGLVRLYDTFGTRRAELPDVELDYSLHTETDRIPVKVGSDTVRVVDGGGKKIWEQAFDFSASDTEIVGRFLVFKDLETNSYRWVIRELEDGTESGTILTEDNVDLGETDGERILMDAKASKNPRLRGTGAYDVASGREAWRLLTPGYTVTIESAGPYLFQATSGEAGRPGTLSRLVA